MVRIYAPEGIAEPQSLALNPLPAPGPGLRVGILHNNKANAGVLLTTMATELAARLGGPAPVLTSKGRASLPAPDDVLHRASTEADLVLVGTAD